MKRLKQRGTVRTREPRSRDSRPSFLMVYGLYIIHGLFTNNLLMYIIQGKFVGMDHCFRLWMDHLFRLRCER